MHQDSLLAGKAISDEHASTDAELIAAIKMTTQDSDCVSDYNLGVADWDTSNDMPLSSQGTQRNAFANIGGCFNSSLYGANSTHFLG